MSTVFYPNAVDEIGEFVRSHDRITVVGNESKRLASPLRTSGDEIGREARPSVISLSRFSGIVEYDPSEFTITAKAGTSLKEIDQALLANGQYMPFDPPLIEHGATLGGTVACGISGPSRLRYGGLRDFVLGVRFVDGRGNFVSAGGKVVKNAAGFDIPKLMVGSWGTLGILTEVTLKVFPRPKEYRTVRLDMPDLGAALQAVHELSRTAIELDALDIDDNDRVLVRVGGSSDIAQASAERVSKLLKGDYQILSGDEDSVFWRPLLDWTWHREKHSFLRVPITTKNVPVLVEFLRRQEARYRFSVAGNLAWIDRPQSDDLPSLHSLLQSQSLSGRILRGDPNGLTTIGRHSIDAFRTNIGAALAPEQKFGFRH